MQRGAVLQNWWPSGGPGVGTLCFAAFKEVAAGWRLSWSACPFKSSALHFACFSDSSDNLVGPIGSFSFYRQRQHYRQSFMQRGPVLQNWWPSGGPGMGTLCFATFKEPAAGWRLSWSACSFKSSALHFACFSDR